MIEWTVIGTGMVVGLMIAMPIGPINLMCMQRALQYGFLSGVATGVGAALGDGLFAAISAFGLTWIAELIEGNVFWLQLFGGVLLVAMGLRTVMTSPAMGVKLPDRTWVHHGGLIGTTFLITITNPAPLLGFIAIFSGLGGVVEGSNYSAAGQLVVAVVIGSFLWWALVARVVTYFRERLTERRLKMINTASGVLILVFGVVVLADLAFGGI